MENMTIKQEMIKTILKAVASLPANQATITHIQKLAGCERHTLAKYLHVLEQQGFLYHVPFGKAKLWYVQRSPLDTLFDAETLNYTQKVFSGLISQMPLGFCVIDYQYKIVYTNAIFDQLYGHPKGKPFYKEVFGLEHPTTLSAFHGVLYEEENRFSTVLADKHGRMLKITGVRIAWEYSDKHAMILIEDVTKSLADSAKVHELSSILATERSAIDSIAIMSETDPQGIITYANDMFCKISGYSRLELLGKPHNIINSGTHPKEFFKDMWKTITGGKIWRGEVCNKSKKGTLYWVDTAIAPVFDAQKKIIKYISVRFDITKYRTK